MTVSSGANPLVVVGEMNNVNTAYSPHKVSVATVSLSGPFYGRAGGFAFGSGNCLRFALGCGCLSLGVMYIKQK